VIPPVEGAERTVNAKKQHGAAEARRRAERTVNAKKQHGVAKARRRAEIAAVWVALPCTPVTPAGGRRHG